MDWLNYALWAVGTLALLLISVGILALADSIKDIGEQLRWQNQVQRREMQIKKGLPVSAYIPEVPD